MSDPPPALLEEMTRLFSGLAFRREATHRYKDFLSADSHVIDWTRRFTTWEESPKTIVASADNLGLTMFRSRLFNIPGINIYYEIHGRAGDAMVVLIWCEEADARRTTIDTLFGIYIAATNEEVYSRFSIALALSE